MGETVKWRLLNSGYNNGYMNMAVDEAMFTLAGDGRRAFSSLRLYGWSPPAISTGYFQNVEQAWLEKKIDVVRRLTGGGAILHDKELTFCLVTVLENSPVPENVSSSYEVISRAIINGLKTMGIDARIRGSGNFERRSSKASARKQAFFCFSRPSKYDIVYDGKKLAGSAQRRKNGILLHHGSILIGEQNLEGSISINSILGREIGMEELGKNIASGFERKLSIELIEGELTGKEIELSRELSENKRNRGMLAYRTQLQNMCDYLGKRY